MRDAAELRVKETDRIETIAANLRRMGGTITTTQDTLEIPGKQKLHAAEIQSCGDHRIAMAFAVAALAASGPCRFTTRKRRRYRTPSSTQRFATLHARRMPVMDEAAESELTREDLIHDLNNVFETITEAADLLSTDRRWKSLAATLGRSVMRGKRLLGAIPDSTPYLAAIVEDAIQSVTDYCIAARKPRLRFVRQIANETRLPGSAKDWERVFLNLFLNAAQIMQKPGRIDIEAQQLEDTLCITFPTMARVFQLTCCRVFFAPMFPPRPAARVPDAACILWRPL